MSLRIMMGVVYRHRGVAMMRVRYRRHQCRFGTLCDGDPCLECKRETPRAADAIAGAKHDNERQNTQHHGAEPPRYERNEAFEL